MPETSELERGEFIQGWIALMQNQGLLVNADTTIMYTLLFGYLLVAHFAGKSLARPQALILTILYIVSFLTTLGNMALNLTANMRMQSAMLDACPECEMNPFVSLQGLTLITVVNSTMLIASLYFMWSVRRHKTE